MLKLTLEPGDIYDRENLVWLIALMTKVALVV